MAELQTNFNHFNVQVKDVHLQIYENGIDVTSLYDYHFNSKNGMFSLIRKDSKPINAGHLIIISDYSIESTDNKLKIDSQNKPKIKKEKIKNNTVVNKMTINHLLLTAATTLILNKKSQKYSEIALNQMTNEIFHYAENKSISIKEDNKDVTNDYLITMNADQISAERKIPDRLSACSITLESTWLISENTIPNTVINSFGSASINNAPIKQVSAKATYQADPTLLWQPGTQKVYAKSNIEEDSLEEIVVVELPPKNKLASPLKNVILQENFSNFKNRIKSISVDIMENAMNARQRYSVQNSKGILNITNIKPELAPQGKLTAIITYFFNNKVKLGDVFKLNGSVILSDGRVDYQSNNNVYTVNAKDLNNNKTNKNFKNKTLLSETPNKKSDIKKVSSNLKTDIKKETNSKSINNLANKTIELVNDGSCATNSNTLSKYEQAYKQKIAAKNGKINTAIRQEKINKSDIKKEQEQNYIKQLKQLKISKEAGIISEKEFKKKVDDILANV